MRTVCPAAAQSAAGFSSLMWSGESRIEFVSAAFFVRGRVLMGGRAGSRKARRCSTGLLTRSVAHPFSSGVGGSYPELEHTMTTAPPSALARNPHCDRQWPHNAVDDHRVAQLIQAAYGATTIAGLLYADACIESNRDDSDTPESEPVPFGNNVKHGLFAALNLCLDEITCMGDALEKCSIRLKERSA